MIFSSQLQRYEFSKETLVKHSGFIASLSHTMNNNSELKLFAVTNKIHHDDAEDVTSLNRHSEIVMR